MAALARRTRTVAPERVTIQSKAVRPSRPPAAVPVRVEAKRELRPAPRPSARTSKPVARSAPRPAARPAVVSRPMAVSRPATVSKPASAAPRAAAVGKGGAENRKYPRAPLTVQAQLRLSSDPRKYFEASLATANISIGGMFLASTFFLKLGTQLDVTLTLSGREVHVKGEVVRIETSGAGGHSGFALRFTEYLDGSEVVLATHFLSPVLREFLGVYAKEHGFKPSDDYVSHSVDLLAAWELKRAELGSGLWLVPKN